MRLTVFLLSALALLGCTREDGTTPNFDTSPDHYISTAEGTQPVGDTLIVVESSSIYSNPDALNPGREHDLQIGDTLRIVGEETPGAVTYFRVHHDGVEGWLEDSYALSSPEYYQALRDSGHAIMVTSQAFTKGSSNEITLNVEFANISQEQTVVSGSVTWELFDDRGNPASTDTHNSTIETAFGSFNFPMPPRGFVSPAFDIGYSPKGSCAEVRKVKLKLANGETSTYEGESLRDIAQEAENIHLKGDCD